MSNRRGEARGDERRVRGRGDVRELLEQGHVLRMAAELVVADEQAEGVAAEGAVLLLVDLLEQLRSGRTRWPARGP